MVDPQGVSLPIDTSRLLSALRQAQDRLRRDGCRADGAAIRGPSHALGLSIAQVVSHLGSQAEIFGLLLDAGLTARTRPARTPFPIWDAWNARSPTTRWRRASPQRDVRARRLEALDPAGWTRSGCSSSAWTSTPACSSACDSPSSPCTRGTSPPPSIPPPPSPRGGGAPRRRSARPQRRVRGSPAPRPVTLRVSTTARPGPMPGHGRGRMEDWTSAPVDGTLELLRGAARVARLRPG